MAFIRLFCEAKLSDGCVLPLWLAGAIRAAEETSDFRLF